MNTTDKIFYILGLILFGILTVVAVLQNIGMFTLTDYGPACSFLSATGFYCPGCGGTHAVCSLAAGHLLESFLYHPAVLYTAAGFALFILWNTAASFTNHLYTQRTSNPHDTGNRRKLPYWHFRTVYVYIGIALLLLQWIIKNLLLIIIG